MSMRRPDFQPSRSRVHELRLLVEEASIDLRRQLAPGTTPYPDHSSSDYLAKIAAARALRDELDKLEMRAAQQARGLGASWADLGTAAGITRASAQSRYGAATVEERRTAYRDRGRSGDKRQSTPQHERSDDR